MTSNYINKSTNLISLFQNKEREQADNVNRRIYTAPPVVKNSAEGDLYVKSKSKTKRILFGSTIASTIFTAGIFGLLLAKGIHGGTLSVWGNKLAKDIQSSSAVKHQNFSSKSKYYAKKGAKKVIDGMQGVSNFTAIKDWLCDKLFRTNKVTTKFTEKTTSGFKKVVDKTLGKKYNKVEISLKDFSSLLREYKIQDLKSLSPSVKSEAVNIKGVTKTLGEWIEILEQQTQRLETTFDKNFSLGARIKRDANRSKLLNDLSQKIKNRFFKNKKSLFDIKNYKTYATEELSRPAQEKLKDEILAAKKELTNNIEYISEGIKTNLNSLLNNIKPDDSSSLKLLNLIKKKLELFKKCSGNNEAIVRENISKEITSMLKNLDNSLSGKKYSVKEKEIIKGLINQTTESVTAAAGNHSKGALEEIMTILNGLKNSKYLTENAYKEYSKLSKKISTGLEKASDLEIGEYFLKQAELKVGSAPTDVLSVLFPIGASTYAIAKADNKDERVSAALTTCIPLVGTFAAFVYGTTKMLSGAKNLIFSLCSGALLGIIGDYCDKLYKKSGSIEGVVKEEYNKLWTGLETQMQKFEESKK